MKLIKRLSCLSAAFVLLISAFIPPVSAASVQAMPTRSAVYINGIGESFTAYTISGNNYFKLRDLAFALSGTEKQFEVTFDEANHQIDLMSNTPYTPVGDEMEAVGSSSGAAASPESYSVFLDGVRHSLTSYIIGSRSFVKLRDLASALNFGVTYLPQDKSIQIDTSSPYTPDSTAAGTDSNITLIGDSIGLDVAPYLKTYYPELIVDAKVSRQFSEAKTVAGQLLNSGRLASTVVIELGTNGTISESQMRSLIDFIGADRKIVFVNVQVPRSWCSGDNKTLSAVCCDYSNTIIADWYNASINKSGYFASDHVHPNKTGSVALAKVIADAVTAIQ